MERFTYRAYIKEGMECNFEEAVMTASKRLNNMVIEGQLMTISMFKSEKNIFVYIECPNKIYEPEDLFSELTPFLANWPGEEQERKWIRMMDIYHCVEPVDNEHWKRKIPVENIIARVMRLKPEMLSSYIFYHWQLQEEKPGSWCKYCSIYLHENLTIMFNEVPDPPETPPYKGKLDTMNTPDDSAWQPLMFEHCIPWEDQMDEYQKMWKNTELLFSFY